VLTVSALVFFPLGGVNSAVDRGRGPQLPDSLTALSVNDDDAPPVRTERWTDSEWGLSIVPPDGWRRSPAQSLNPISSPPDPVFEVARFQLRLRDPSLYAQPVALTSGLLADAGAVLSIGLAREDSGLVGADPERWDETSRALPGFVATDEELDYEGLRTFTRYFYARGSDRVVIVRLIADDDEWSAVAAPLLTSVSSLLADPAKANGPVALAPPPPVPAGDGGQSLPTFDPSFEIRGAMLARATSLLNIPYVWGGNSTKNGMDCSAWLSRVWGVDRYGTDSIWQVSFQISKEELRPGDAMNLTTGRDPKRLGHIRLFEAWANAAHTVMWVYEETPPRSVHRVVVYDDRYEPIRLFGLSGAGVALIVPGTPAPERTLQPRPTKRATPRVTPRPTMRTTTRATPRPTPRPSGSVKPGGIRVVMPSPSPIPLPSTPREDR
jgi:hypothetical protein